MFVIATSQIMNRFMELSDLAKFMSLRGAKCNETKKQSVVFFLNS